MALLRERKTHAQNPGGMNNVVLAHIAILCCFPLMTFAFVAMESTLNFMMLPDLVPMFGLILVFVLPPTMGYFVMSIVN